MSKGIRQFISLMLISLVIGAFIIFAFFFTLILLFAWAVVEILLRYSSPANKGKIVSNGQVISVDYHVVEEKEVPHSQGNPKK